MSNLQEFMIDRDGRSVIVAEEAIVVGNQFMPDPNNWLIAVYDDNDRRNATMSVTLADIRDLRDFLVNANLEDW